MVHSQLQVPPLLCALLMLLPLGMPAGLSHVPVTDAGVQTALAFAVQQYNWEQHDSANYFKLLHLGKAQSQVLTRFEYHLIVVLVKTGCKKTTGEKKTYQKIQQCKRLLGNPQITCYFKVTSCHQLNDMQLEITTCV